MRRLTADEVALLNRARRLLQDLSADAQTSTRSPEEPKREDLWTGYTLGLMAERCSSGEQAIFDALNALYNFGDDEQAGAAIEAYHKPGGDA